MAGGDGRALPGRAREALAQNLLFVVLVLAIPLALASISHTFDDGDTSWHIAVGRWIAGHGRIPTTDPFSFTAFGRPWVAMEWSADLIMAAAFQVAGYPGLATLIAAALMALHWIVFRHLQRSAGPLGIAATIIALDVMIGTFILARPHVLVWPLLAAWTALLARASETGRPPPLWAALIPLVWTNLHGSFPLAAVIAVPLALDSLEKAEWRTLRAWALFAAASLAAILLNANGPSGLLQPFRVANLQTLGFIQEWQPSTLPMTPQFYCVLLLGLGALLWTGVRAPIGRLVLLLVMLGLAFSQVRHQSWFAITAALLVPPLFTSRAGPVRNEAWLAFAAVPLLAARALWPLTPPENAANPRHILAAIPEELRGQPVLNGYTFGGPLILDGIRPYIDGRSELYGDAFVEDYREIIGGDATRFNSAVDRYRIRWTILPNSNVELIRQLDGSGRWRRIYSDRVGVIHVRADQQR